MLTVPTALLVICSEKERTVKKRGKSPKTTSVDRCKSLRNRCKVVPRAKHNTKALESTFVARLVAPETADNQKIL